MAALEGRASRYDFRLRPGEITRTGSMGDTVQRGRYGNLCSMRLVCVGCLQSGSLVWSGGGSVGILPAA